MKRRLPAVRPRQIIRAPERAGFVVTRIMGSHHSLAHRDEPSRMTNVPAHGSKDLPRGTLADIILDEFLALR